MRLLLEYVLSSALSSAIIFRLMLKLRLKGDIPLVVEVENADIIATLLRLKAEVDIKTGGTLRLSTFLGIILSVDMY